MKLLLFDPQNMPQMDKWREYFNPLRHLTTAMVVGWLQNQQLGIVSDISWLYRFIEERDPILSTIVDRRTSALEKLSWDVKLRTDEEIKQLGGTPQMAQDQQGMLRSRYANIDNMRDAINFKSLASFRGFSHLEKHYDSKGNECHLEPVPQWNWARSGMFGKWYYNQSAVSIPGPQSGLAPTPQLKEIDPANFIIREVDRPIDVVAIWSVIRRGMSQKDWDGWIETFGIAPIFIELPENMPVEKQQEYQSVVEGIISDARGTLPNGAKVQTVKAEGGPDPFEKHMRYQDEMVILKGTGGLLTVLTQAGSGTLAGGAHQDSFDLLAEADADRISEVFQAQFDRPILDEEFAGQPRLAFFKIAAKESTDTEQVVADVASLRTAGYSVAAEQVEELTGYQVEPIAPEPAKGPDEEEGPGKTVNNRALRNRTDDPDLQDLIKTLGDHVDDATSAEWAPIMNRVRAMLDSPDGQFLSNAQKLHDDVPDLLKGQDPETVQAWQEALVPMLFNGFADGLPKPSKKGVSRAKPSGAAKNGAKPGLQRFATVRRKARDPQKT